MNFIKKKGKKKQKIVIKGAENFHYENEEEKTLREAEQIINSFLSRETSSQNPKQVKTRVFSNFQSQKKEPLDESSQLTLSKDASLSKLQPDSPAFEIRKPPESKTSKYHLKIHNFAQTPPGEAEPMNKAPDAEDHPLETLVRKSRNTEKSGEISLEMSKKSKGVSTQVHKVEIKNPFVKDEEEDLTRIMDDSLLQHSHLKIEANASFRSLSNKSLIEQFEK